MNRAIDYLLPYQDSFWRWRDGGEVLAWVDGPTIAFRAEVLTVMRRLAPHGLPPFNSVVLLLAATRDNWRERTAEPRVLSGLLGVLPKASGEFSVQARGVLGAVLGELDRVRLADSELRRSAEAKAALSEMVFEGVEAQTSVEEAYAVVDLIDRGVGEETTDRYPRPWPHGQGELLEELRFLYLGLRTFDPNTLMQRLEIGLDGPPEPADVDVPPAQRVRALLSELEHDEELSRLAMLARDLMAAVALPRSLADREELPIGGFSDIANRGSLDRLLLSELAYDDMTLAVRVAVNEALYLRRESPPKCPPCQRAVLLETGIRSWGVPRVFATAVALALVATGERHTELQMCRAKGNRVEPVDLTTRAGLTAHLAALEVDVHPGEALDAFQKEIADWDHVAEPVIVTSEDVLADPQFRLALSESGVAPLLLATVNREGDFRLVERTLHGERLVREAELNLDSLFAEPKRTVPTLVDRDVPKGLPAILSVHPFPLRLSHHVDPARTWWGGNRGVLSLTQDRRLMFWTDPGYGAIQITDKAPRGKLHWWSASKTGTSQAVAGPTVRGGLQLLDVDLENYRCRVEPLGTELLPEVLFSHHGILFATTKDGRRIDVLDGTSGQLLQTMTNPFNVRWRHGRFFEKPHSGEWLATSYDGRTVHFESVVDQETLGDIELIAMFERDGVDGPIGVTQRGHLYMTAARKLRKVKHSLAGSVQVLAIAGDGRLLALGQGGAASTRCSLVDVDELTVTPQYGDPRQLVEPTRGFVGIDNYRNRFAGVYVDQRNVLNLVCRSGYAFAIDNISFDHVRLVPHGKSNWDLRPFQPVPAPDGVGYRLKVAVLSNGGRVFLDSRGLLHLKSADKTIPETTIVLCNDGELSGWCSDGRLWGTSYHLGDQQSSDLISVYETAIQPFMQRL